MMVNTACRGRLREGLDVETMMIHAWVWLRMHPKTAIALCLLAVIGLSALLTAPMALADTEAEEALEGGNHRTFGLPTSGVNDSEGIHISSYAEMPLDTGSAANVVASVRSAIVGMSWSLYYAVVVLVAALVTFVMSFVWLDWLATPFVYIGNTLETVLGQMGILTIGLSISTLVIAFGIMRGRTASGFIEAFMVALVMALIATPAGNPSEHLTGEDGWIQWSADTGEELGEEISTDHHGGTSTSSPMSGTVIDMTVRQPWLTMAFGSTLEDVENEGNPDESCADTWNSEGDGSGSTNTNDSDEVLGLMTGCNEEIADYAEAHNWTVLGMMVLFGLGTAAILSVMLLFLFFIIKSVIQALLSALNVVIKAYLAVFPGNGRAGFFTALAMLGVNIGMIALYLITFTILLILFDRILRMIPGEGLMIVQQLMGVFMLIMVIVFFQVRRKGKNLAEMLGQKLGNTGLNSSTPPQPSSFGRLAKGAAAGAGYKAAGGAGRMTKSAAGKVVKSQLLRRGAKALATKSAAAATGGTSLAVQGGLTAARMAGRRAMSAGRKAAPKQVSARPGAAAGGEHALPQGASTATGMPRGAERKAIPSGASSAQQPAIAAPVGQRRAAETRTRNTAPGGKLPPGRSGHGASAELPASSQGGVGQPSGQFSPQDNEGSAQPATKQQGGFHPHVPEGREQIDPSDAQHQEVEKQARQASGRDTGSFQAGTGPQVVSRSDHHPRYGSTTSRQGQWTGPGGKGSGESGHEAPAETRATAAASGSSTKGTAGQPRPVDPERERKRQAKVRQTSLPSGRHGSTRVSADGRAVPVVSGDVVNEIPDDVKVSKSWDRGPKPESRRKSKRPVVGRSKSPGRRA